MVRNKKAVSAVIGYVLLVTFGIVMSVIVFNYLKTYVPKEELKCPDGISVVLQSYSCSEGKLNITVRNNGKFNLAGFFVHGSDNSEVDIATIDLSKYFQKGSQNQSAYNGALLFHVSSDNLMKPGAEDTYTFMDIEESLVSIELMPARFQRDDNNVLRFVSCSQAKITENLICG